MPDRSPTSTSNHGVAGSPLAGIRVLEMGALIAGPFCGQLFADFGAEVIKIEEPSAGDPMRQWGTEDAHGQSLWFPVIGRNKKSVTCNLRTEPGRDLMRRLVASADVVVENFRPGTLERWGLGYAELSADNPGLVLIRVSGFGQTGPYAQRPGYGSIGEAMGGLRYVVGDQATPPSRVGVSIGDSLAGLFATLGGLVALRERDRSGRGQVVDAAIYEAVLGVMESLVPDYALGGRIKERSGPILPGIAPSNVYPTSDGDMLLIAANQDTVFARLAQAMGRPDLAADPRFATHGARGEHQTELDELVSTWTAGLTREKLQVSLDEHQVPNGLIYRAPEMLADPHFAARQAIVRLAHPVLGDFPMHNVFPRLSRTPGVVEAVGPGLGEHNREVYVDLLGLSEPDLAALREQGIV